MYLQEITITGGLKLLKKNFKLSFMSGDQPRMWTALVGENGLCKTSILQAIALAASGPDRANQLRQDVESLRDTRRKISRLEIDARFTFSAERHQQREYPGLTDSSVVPVVRSIVSLSHDEDVFSGHSTYEGESAKQHAVSNGVSPSNPVRDARAKALPRWFVAGYGVNRNLPVRGEVPPTNLVLERLKPLFDQGKVIGTGFVDLFQQAGKAKLAREYSSCLKKVLCETQDLLPFVDDVELRGRGGIKSSEQLVKSNRFTMRFRDSAAKVPATWLSQGYQSTIAWIADLVGQIFSEADEAVAPAEMEGLVLVDELDLHLHPAWQSKLVTALRGAFPRMQFIVTTHSPMVLAGLRKDEIMRLYINEDGDVDVRESDRLPALLMASEIYEDYFGMSDAYPNQLGADFAEFGYLASNPWRSDDDEKQLLKLETTLRSEGILPESFRAVPRKGGRT